MADLLATDTRRQAHRQVAVQAVTQHPQQALAIGRRQLPPQGREGRRDRRLYRRRGGTVARRGARVVLMGTVELLELVDTLVALPHPARRAPRPGTR